MVVGRGERGEYVVHFQAGELAVGIAVEEFLWEARADRRISRDVFGVSRGRIGDCAGRGREWGVDFFRA